MPINKKESISNVVKEVMHSYKKRGSIGTSTPSSLAKARKQAIAIAFSLKKKQRGK